MKRAWAVLAASWIAGMPAGVTAAPAFAADCDVAYSFRADWAAVPRHFAAELAFPAGGRSETAIRISREWAGVADFHAGVVRVHGVGAGIDVTPAEAPYRWVVKHPPQGLVRVAYDVVNTRPNVDGDGPMDHRDFFRNALGAGYFHLFGHGVLLQPESQADAEPVMACVAFMGMPAEWRFASNRTAGANGGSAQWRGRASPQSMRASLFVGGDFRVLRREIEGRPLWIAIRGAWSFADEAFADATARVVAGQRRFWNDFAFPHYLISLSPNLLPQGSNGGTAIQDAFAMHASRDMALKGFAFEGILAHEHVHTWLPRRLGTMGIDGEAARYWFSEGFTEYLTHRLLLRDGSWSLEDYARALNGVLRAHWTSSARDLPNARVAEGFWKDSTLQRLPYRRGELFAVLVARKLAERGASLDSILRGLALSEDAVPRETDRREADLAVNRLLAALRGRLDDSADSDVREYIDEGRSLPVDEGFLGPCFRGAWVERPVFALGFDPASLRGRTLAGLVPGSNAEKAGLRDGMALAGWSIYSGDSTKEVTVQVKEEGRVRDVKYMPVAAESVRIPEFTVRTGAATDPACRAWKE